MELQNKSKEELILDLLNVQEALKNMTLDYSKVIAILKEIEETAAIIKSKRGIFKAFQVAKCAYDIVEILNKK